MRRKTTARKEGRSYDPIAAVKIRRRTEGRELRDDHPHDKGDDESLEESASGDLVASAFAECDDRYDIATFISSPFAERCGSLSSNDFLCYLLFRCGETSIILLLLSFQKADLVVQKRVYAASGRARFPTARRS